MAKLQRKTPKQQRELKDKLDSLDDGEVLDLFEGIGAYIKENFVETGEDGKEETDGGSGQRSSETPSAVARFFGAE